MKLPLDLALARDAAVMVVGNATAGLLFLAVHMVGGRWMPAGEYAAFVALLGLLWIVLVPSSALQVAVARYAAEYCHASETELWGRLFRSVMRLVTAVGLPAAAAWLAAAGPLARALHAPSPGTVRWVGVIAWLSIYAPVISGALQGARRFGWMAAAAIVPGVVRLALAIPIACSVGTASAMLGAYAASVAAGLAAGGWPLRRAAAGAAPLDLAPFTRYFLPVAGGQLLLYALMNADLILAPRLLEGAVFHCYGKASMLARTVLFLPMPLVLAMFPRAVVSTRRRTLLQPAAMALVLSVGLAAGLTLAPRLALRWMYGVEGAVYERLLRLYAWAVVPVAMVNVLSQYLWARHDVVALAGLAPVAAAYVGLLWTGPRGDPLSVITSLAAANVAACATLAWRVRRLWRGGGR